ncbi:DUF2254 family protein, partial [Klebsiella pneumoniae]|uniref:DUF2254 family protein n=1 Tax=Klebsiella pneumoniae TaxID=573 RepID=UPI0022B9E922
AAKALSPGVNDPGTAIQVIGTGVRLLDVWVQPPEDDGPRPPRCDRLLGPGVAAEDLLEDLFGPIARYGAGDLAVAMRLQ